MPAGLLSVASRQQICSDGVEGRDSECAARTAQSPVEWYLVGYIVQVLVEEGGHWQDGPVVGGEETFPCIGLPKVGFTCPVNKAM